jgi:uncharacterized protein (DUF1015 family)
MADIRAFRAHRYDLGRVGALSDVVAPPYDVIDSTLQDQLYAKSPYNAVRLILNREEAGDTEARNRYSRARQHLRDWLRDDVLSQDRAPGLYVCEQEFTIEGEKHKRRGFFARVRLEAFGEGKIFPHEETMPGPRADRLQLFRATEMNLSPVFGLYPDDEQSVQHRLDAAIGRALPVEARDHLGVTSRLWPVHDSSAVNAVTGLMGPRPVFIADGHHRYETALTYRKERREGAGELDRDAAVNFVLMYLVSMSDPGLIILPTHRLVNDVSNLTAERLRQRVDEHFRLEVAGSGEEGARRAWKLIEEDGTQQALGFGTRADGRWVVAWFRGDESVMKKLTPTHGPEWRSLAVSVLHELVLGKLLREDPTSKPKCSYVHLLSEVIAAMAGGQCQLAALVPSVGMSEVTAIAGHQEKMPPKSTYFYPKILSGLLFNSLAGEASKG